MESRVPTSVHSEKTNAQEKRMKSQQGNSKRISGQAHGQPVLVKEIKRSERGRLFAGGGAIVYTCAKKSELQIWGAGGATCSRATSLLAEYSPSPLGSLRNEHKINTKSYFPGKLPQGGGVGALEGNESS